MLDKCKGYRLLEHILLEAMYIPGNTNCQTNVWASREGSLSNSEVPELVIAFFSQWETWTVLTGHFSYLKLHLLTGMHGCVLGAALSGSVAPCAETGCAWTAAAQQLCSSQQNHTVLLLDFSAALLPSTGLTTSSSWLPRNEVVNE